MQEFEHSFAYHTSDVARTWAAAAYEAEQAVRDTLEENDPDVYGFCRQWQYASTAKDAEAQEYRAYAETARV
jgi:hypothetical protein